MNLLYLNFLTIFVIIFLFYMLVHNRRIIRGQCKKIREFFDLTVEKRGGDVIKGLWPFNSYPEYHFLYDETEVKILLTTNLCDGEAPDTPDMMSTKVIISLKNEPDCFLSIKGGDIKFLKVVDRILEKTKIIPSTFGIGKYEIEDKYFFQEKIKVYSDSSVFIYQFLASEEVRGKIVDINKIFSFFMLDMQKHTISCMVLGIPDSHDDLEKLINLTLFSYDRCKILGQI